MNIASWFVGPLLIEADRCGEGEEGEHRRASAYFCLQPNWRQQSIIYLKGLFTSSSLRAGRKGSSRRTGENGTNKGQPGHQNAFMNKDMNFYFITLYYAGIILSPSSISIQPATWLKTVSAPPAPMTWRIIKNTAKDAGPTRPAHKFRQ